MKETIMVHRISENDIIAAASNQVSCQLEGEAVILNLKDGLYYGLDPVGARIWDLIREPKAMSQILGILLEEFEVEPDVCAKELEAMLQDLESKDLIEVTREASV